MSTVITAAASATPLPGETTASVRLAGAAARDCLTRAGLSPDAIGTLINVGVYREQNTTEPAMAALVQKEAGINLDHLLAPDAAPAFSFDLMNGACGLLNAVQAAGALLSTGSTDRVLVTAADTHPGGRAADDPAYPYADLGAALLLERSSEPDAGFGPVRFATARGPVGGAGYLDTATMGTEGRRRITVERDADWAQRLVELAAETAADYLRAEGLDPARTRLVCNRPAPGFAAAVAARLGMPPQAPAVESVDDRAPHTAALVLDYLRAVEQEPPAGHDHLLFVCAGAGLSAGCVSYRPVAVTS
ncbi:hypothetical protein [Kitasatospora sp. NPDC093102]|uniref:hypothetical protein n=1 Tax=Kitasatospora sp. NPDC093102 TaxID=3155069 RepID=UPI003419F08D